MKILLIGGSGMIGSRILAEALARGHSVTATSRKPGGIAPAPGVTPVALTLAEAGRLADLAGSVDVVVGASSPRSTGDALAEAQAHATALIAAARTAGKRLVMVGGAGSLNLPDGSPVLPDVPEPYAAEAAGMKAACQALQDSGADWTFVAPSLAIAPGPRRPYRIGGDRVLFDADGKSEIGAEDFAAALMDEVERPAHRRAIMTVGY